MSHKAPRLTPVEPRSRGMLCHRGPSAGPRVLNRVQKMDVDGHMVTTLGLKTVIRRLISYFSVTVNHQPTFQIVLRQTGEI